MSLQLSQANENSEDNLNSVQPPNLQVGGAEPSLSMETTESTLAPATDKTIANDIESLPVDQLDQPQPVSLSHIELEEIC